MSRFPLRLDPQLLRSPGLAPLFRLASQASAVAPLEADRPMQAFRSGWYLFDARFAPGAQDATQLVVDYGEGFAWLERLSPRHPDASGGLRSVVAIKRRPAGFGLLTGRDGEVPGLRAASLQPIGRTRALVEMLRGIHQSAPRRPRHAVANAALAFLRGLLREGRAAAATALVARYEATSRGVVHDYSAWLAANEHASEPGGIDTEDMSARRPLFSILMAVQGAKFAAAMRSVHSVRQQSWPGWQLCMAHADDLPPPALAELRALAAGDPRIVLVPVSGETRSAAWSCALALATGDYCARLPAGDRLAPGALHEVSLALRRQPWAAVIYSDHDSMGDTGQRSAPVFKQDWSPDLACQRDAMLHPGLIERHMLRDMGAAAGGDAFDVLLRACDAAGPERILHVPRVLYHRQPGAHRPADDVAAVRALQAHLARRGQAGQVSVVADGRYRVAHPLPATLPSVEVVVPTRDQHKLLARCMEGVLRDTEYANLRVLLIDNDSRDPQMAALLERLARDPRVRVQREPGAFNFSRLVNRAARDSRAELLCLLNDDVLPLQSGWLQEMVAHALRPDIGAVGAMLRFPDGSVQHAGVVTGVGGVAGHVHYRLPREAAAGCAQLATVRNYSAVTAACMVVRRDRFLRVGGFDEGLPVCYNDVDFCLRLRARGYFNVWTPFAVLAHHESATRGPDDTPLKRARHQREFARMLSRWGDRLARDPAYNPNLSLYGEPFELAHAPRIEADFEPAYPRRPDTGPALEAIPASGR
jgi:GT2 family glycosyltransferase